MSRPIAPRSTLLAAAGAALLTACAAEVDIDQASLRREGLTGERAAELKTAAAYRGILGRAPDDDGLAHHAGLLADGHATLVVTQGLFVSAEFAERRGHLDAAALADALYQGILRRAADPDGRTATIDAIETGRRAERAAAMLDSAEFVERFLDGSDPLAGEPAGADAAEIDAASLPDTLACGASFGASVRVRNSGSATWTADLYKLGADGDSDPLYTRDTRVLLAPGTRVAPGETAVFSFTLQAPATPGTYVTDWRMVHEHVAWFGETVRRQVTVACAGPPGPSDLPPPGVPVSPGLLLRQANARLHLLGTGAPFDAFMAVQCCREAPAEVGNSRWPLASESWMDYAGQYGANLFHFRLGPFFGDAEHESEWADVGGAYLTPGGAFNPAFWAKVRALVWYAYQRGAYVEVNPIDTWYCKHAQWGDQAMPWPSEDVEACGRRASAEQERFLRHTVAQLGCFPNLIWLDGNEVDQISGYSPTWTQWVQSVVRDEEVRSGCGFVHLFGTNAAGNASAVGSVDYVATHAKAPLLEPIGGRWTINNERNPAFTPDTEASYFAQARAAGLAWAFWRAGMSEAEMVDTLSQFRAVAQGGDVGCHIPADDAEGWRFVGAAASVRPSQTLSWVLAAEAAVGDRTGQPPTQTLALVAAELRRMGYCASGPWGDAVGVLAPDGTYEEMHSVAYTDGGYTSASRKFISLWAFDR